MSASKLKTVATGQAQAQQLANMKPKDQIPMLILDEELDELGQTRFCLSGPTVRAILAGNGKKEM